MFARHDVVVGDTRAWLADATVRDVPHPGEAIGEGRPVCTVFAEGADARECYAALVDRAAAHLRSSSNSNLEVCAVTLTTKATEITGKTPETCSVLSGALLVQGASNAFVSTGLRIFANSS